jgi:hypothetical protein
LNLQADFQMGGSSKLMLDRLNRVFQEISGWGYGQNVYDNLKSVDAFWRNSTDGLRRVEKGLHATPTQTFRNGMKLIGSRNIPIQARV